MLAARGSVRPATGCEVPRMSTKGVRIADAAVFNSVYLKRNAYVNLSYYYSLLVPLRYWKGPG